MLILLVILEDMGLSAVGVLDSFWYPTEMKDLRFLRLFWQYFLVLQSVCLMSIWGFTCVVLLIFTCVSAERQKAPNLWAFVFLVLGSAKCFYALLLLYN